MSRSSPESILYYDNNSCLGTLNIQIQKMSPDLALLPSSQIIMTEGVLALYACNPLKLGHFANSTVLETPDCENSVDDKDNTNMLYVMITDGLHTYSSELLLDTINVNKTENKIDLYKSKQMMVTSWILQPHLHPDITIQYRRKILDKSKNDEHHNSIPIQLTIKQTIGSIVCVILSMDLLPISTSYQTLNDDTTPPDLLQFIKPLTSSLQAHRNQIQNLHEQIQTITKQVHTWKDTATKLDVHVWQKEKDDLFQRFLFLLNRVKGKNRELQHELTTLKSQVKSQQQQEAGIENTKLKDLDSSDNTNTKDFSEHPKLVKGTVIDDDEAEHDVILYDKNLVDDLASGRRVVYKSISEELRSSCNKEEHEHEHDNQQEENLDQQKMNQQQTVNPYTGAVEIWDVNTMFNDSGGAVNMNNVETREKNGSSSRIIGPNDKDIDIVDDESRTKRMRV